MRLLFCTFVVGLLLAGCGGQRQLSSYLAPGVPGSPYFNPEELAAGEILHVATGSRLDKEQFFTLLDPARIVYLGEGHDNIYDHHWQLEVMRELFNRHQGRIMVGMEMLAAASQEKINAWLAGKLDEDDFLRLFAADWGLDAYPYYREIFAFIRQKQLPLVALNVSRSEKMTAMRQFSGDGAGRKGSEPATVDPYQQKALTAMFAGHAEGHGSQEMFIHIQQLWEDTMAAHLAAALKAPENQDKVMLVISGAFHVARGYGLPRRVFQRFPVDYRIVLTHTPEPLVENERQLMEVDFPELPLPLADFIGCVPYRNLKDVQVRLGVGLEETEDGLKVTEVAPDSAAAGGGIMVGDLLLMAAERPLHEVFDLKAELLNKKPGESLRLQLRRDGRKMILEPVL